LIPVTGIVHGTSQSRERILQQQGPHTTASINVIVLNLTQRCPLKCIYCYASSGGSQELDFSKLYQNFIRFLDKVKPRVLIISGGEPLYYSHIWDLLEELRKYNTCVSLSTSGMCLDEDAVNKLKYFGVRYVGVSLDSPSSYADSKIRKASSLEKIISSINILKKYDIEVGLRTTLTWVSYASVDNLIEFCKKFNIGRLCLYYLMPSGRGRDLYNTLALNNHYIRAKFLVYITKLVECNPDVDILLVTEPSDMLAIALLSSDNEDEFYRKVRTWCNRTMCGAGSKIISIFYDGEVHPCQFMRDIACGNIMNNTILDILTKAREIHLKLPTCRYCTFLNYCHGCPIKIAYGRSAIDPECALLSLYLSLDRIRLASWQMKILREWACTLHHEAFQEAGS